MSRTGSGAPAPGLAEVLAQPHRALPLLFGVTLLARLVVFPVATEANLTPDGARFFNIARCIERGQGFSTPEAWPAWTRPDALPMPETFKEPGYPYAIAALKPVAGSFYAAGRAVSFAAGLVIPLLVFGLALRTGAGGATALAAGLLVAASPLMNVLASVVMAEALFVAALSAAFWVAAGRGGNARPAALRAMLAGALFGAAFLVRAQALIALPAFLLLCAGGLPRREVLTRGVLALLAAQLVAAPLLVRNVLLSGAPLYSDAAAFGVWPYVDPIGFSSSLERPPAALPFALAHPGAVLGQMVESARVFVRWTFPRDVLPGLLWWIPCAVGAGAALRARRAGAGPRWGFIAWLFALTLPFLFAVYWAPRYFAMLVPAFALLAALGLASLERMTGLARRPRLAGLATLALALGAAVPGVMLARTQAGAFETPDARAAREEAAFLRERLAPGEAVMCDVTSYWAWHVDRPAVHVIIASEDALAREIERLRVRWAALPAAKVDAYAARFPEGRLPDLFVPHHVNDAAGVIVYEVRPDAPGADPPNPSSGGAR